VQYEIISVFGRTCKIELMRVAVTDANIFIDLIKLDLIAHLFAIELEIYTTLEVVDELNEAQIQILKAYQQADRLFIHISTEEEYERIEFLEAPKALSYTDRSVIVLAETLDAILLTGDGAVRRFCEKEHKEVRGILWVLDCFLEFQCLNYAEAVEKMEALLNINNRLPKSECEERMKKWKKMTL
jgi:hypothetical protein